MGLTGLVVIYLLILGFAHSPWSEKFSRREPVSAATNQVKTLEEERTAKDNKAWFDQIRMWADTETQLQDVDLKIHQGKLTEAQEQLRSILKRNPDSIGADMALAQVCFQRSEYDEALDLLELVLSAEPTQASAKALLVQALLAQGYYEPALHAVEWIMISDPYSLDAHQWAAMALLHLNRPADAADHLRKVVSIDHGNVGAQNLLSDAYTQMGLMDKAIETLQRIQQIDPNNSVSYYNLAVCYARESRATQAVDVLAQASGLFGVTFVQTWMKAKEFDAVRSDPLFQKLQNQSVQPSAATSTETTVISP